MTQSFFPFRRRASARRLNRSLLALLAVVFAALSVSTLSATTACNVTYTINSQWSGGFGASLAIQNTGTTAWSSWTLTWTFANGQTISQFWNGTETQSGSNVSVASLSYNGSIAAGATYSGAGLNGTWNNVTNSVPAAFAVNGTTCGSSSSLSATTTTLATSATSAATGASVTLTATVAPSAASGTVTFYDGSTSLGSSTLSSGKAALSTSFSTAGTHSITAVYGGSTTYATSTSGAVSITVTSASKTATTTTLTSSSTSTTAGTAFTLTAVVAPSAATGTVTFYEGSVALGSATLSSGSAALSTSLSTAGTYSLTAVYGGSTTYATSTSGAVTLTITSSSSADAVVTLNPSSKGVAVTDMILGMNLAAWYDVVSNKTAIVNGFATAGIKAVRWPGGSWSDIYHWSTNTNCFSSTDGAPKTNDTFANFVTDVVTPAGLDVSLTANYGTNTACTGGGDPTEAAAWAAQAVSLGANVSHITVGNEVYGSWEEDLHSAAHDPTTYATAVASGYYPDIKAVDSSVLVGVVVQPDYTWDSIVLADAKYDFVEFHFYPETPGQENDTALVQQDAQKLTTYINTIKSELATAGHSGTPIYIGEMGSVYSTPGKQSMSISQALFAGQTLGEMMNDGVSRATWWIGFGGCADSTYGANFSSSLYGWQTFGGYMVFSDGLSDGYECTAETLAAGTLLPTARAFQLFSNVAVNGEYVLTPSVSGDTTNVRAYAATHSGGTALVLFNLNETSSESVQVNLTNVTSSTAVTVQTYDKAIYDQSESGVWAAPSTTTLGAQSMPLTLTLTPWSMNVVTIK